MKTIVAIDDDYMCLEILDEMLNDKGVKLISFDEVSEAFKFLDSTEDSIDLFLIDIKMEEQTGLEVLKKLKQSEKEYNRTPVIMVSAISTREYRELAFHLGAAEYVSKPFGETEFCNIVQNYLPENVC